MKFIKIKNEQKINNYNSKQSFTPGGRRHSVEMRTNDKFFGQNIAELTLKVSNEADMPTEIGPTRATACLRAASSAYSTSRQ